jgi:hypothetical protein
MQQVFVYYFFFPRRNIRQLELLRASDLERQVDDASVQCVSIPISTATSHEWTEQSAAWDGPRNGDEIRAFRYVINGSSLYYRKLLTFRYVNRRDSGQTIQAQRVRPIFTANGVAVVCDSVCRSVRYRAVPPLPFLVSITLRVGNFFPGVVETVDPASPFYFFLSSCSVHRWSRGRQVLW